MYLEASGNYGSQPDDSGPFTLVASLNGGGGGGASYGGGLGGCDFFYSM